MKYEGDKTATEVEEQTKLFWDKWAESSKDLPDPMEPILDKMLELAKTHAERNAYERNNIEVALERWKAKNESN